MVRLVYDDCFQVLWSKFRQSLWLEQGLVRCHSPAYILQCEIQWSCPRLTHLLARLLDGRCLVRAPLSNVGVFVLLERPLGVQARHY